MNQLLGLIDALEAIVLEGKKVPFTHNVILNEKIVLDLLDKLRFTIQSDGNNVRKSVDRSKNNEDTLEIGKEDSISITEEYADLDLSKIKKEADKLQQDADEYADYVLANLQLMLAKMQKNMVTLEKNIENGRIVLEQTKQEKDILKSEVIHET